VAVSRTGPTSAASSAACFGGMLSSRNLNDAFGRAGLLEPRLRLDLRRRHPLP
jgi:hypothetical protein